MMSQYEVASEDDSRALLAAIIESSDDAILSKTLDGTITSWNGGAERLYGYTAAEMIGHSVGRLFPPDLADEMPSILDRLRRGERIAPYDTERVRKDGSPVSVSVTISPIRDAAGRVIGASTVARDITGRKQVEKALRESEARFRSLVEATAQIVWTNDAAGKMRGPNPDWGAFTGQTEEEYQGYGWSRAVHPDDAQPTIDAWEEAVAARKPFVFEHRLRRRDGVYRLFAIRAVPVVDEDGELREWIGIHNDITERRQAREALRASEERYRLLAEAVPSLAWINGPDGAALFYNQRWSDYTGRPTPQFEGTGFLAAVHPDDARRLAEDRARAIAAGRPYEMEMRLRRHDGVYRWHAARVVPTRDESGAVAAWFGAALDITERKAAEEALRAAYDRQSRIAETLQLSMLRRLAADAFPGLRVETLYAAALEEAKVGGDYFDAFALAGGRVALVVGDVSGKGLAAAAHTAEVKYALRAFLHEYADPAVALARLNDFLCDADQSDDPGRVTLVVLVLAVLDPVTGEASFVTAGAEPPLLLRPDGTDEVVRASGRPLGIEPGAVYAGTSGRLSPGDTLIMATDGITEARRGHEFLGQEGMAALARAAGTAASLTEIGQAILDGARAFTGGALRDDACLLLARRG